MPDELPESPPVEAPAKIPGSAVPVDEGLDSWAKVVQSSLAAQNGVQIMGRSGSSVHFKFRGQEFAVHVHRKA